MKSFVCDICGVSTKQYEISELYEELKPDGINDVCEGCRAEIVTAKRKIEDALKPIRAGWVKSVILKMKNR